jgi:DNA polymerase III epsilon subunit-like protein
MYLFLDTETTGLPRNWKAPITDSENWPRLVQIAWMEFDSDERMILSQDRIIKPEGFEIPEAAARIHGVTTQRALAEGKPLRDVMNEFLQALKRARYLIAHNISFDECILGAEMHRLSMTNSLSSVKQLCTKELSTQFCKLPSRYGYKWPTLQELHVKLFGMEFAAAHDAGVDVDICSKCFFELKKLGQIHIATTETLESA